MGSPLIAFALVADEYESSGDPIRGLKPLFAPLLHDRMGKEFDAIEFSQRFKANYGLEMTPFVANALKEVLKKIGLIQEAKIGLFQVADYEWSPETIDERLIDETLGLFTKWAKERLLAISRCFDDKQLEEAIFSRLARPAFASIFVDDNAEKKSRRFKGLLGLGAIDSSVKDEIYLDYLVADFVLAANDSAPKVFDALSKIAYGSLVADAVAGLATSVPTPGEKQTLRVVLDGPLIMDLLDLNTPEHQEYARGLMAILADADVTLIVFDHSVDEMRGTIASTLSAYANKDAYGPLAERFRTTPGHRLYAVAVMDSLETRIKNLGITILPSKVYEEARFKKYFSEERVDQVRNSIGDLHEHVEARIRDTLSVATVARMKGERRLANSLFDAGTVFVTRNSMLARRVNRALSLGRSGPDPRFTIVTDGQIAGILWFVAGFSVIAQLSRTRLIANCSAAVLPKREIISRIAGRLEGLSPKLKVEFEALMTDQRASLCPMRITSGAVDSIDDELSLHVLSAMKEVLISPMVERVESVESMLKKREEELLLSHGERQGAVLSMQEAVLSAELSLEEKTTSFDSQLTQLKFTLDSQTRILDEKSSTEKRRAADLEQSILMATNDIHSAERRAKRILAGIVISASAALSLFSIFYPDYTSIYLQIGLAIIYILSIKFVVNYWERFTSWLVSFMFSSKRSYLLGLEQARIL